ncbi:Mediator of RNA polymerase II transcription subunit 16 [Elasticomyces elasticus]|nr:Mediator of RNA polymerase II transcription subunit 16 [Elasticomyces elasticus]
MDDQTMTGPTGMPEVDQHLAGDGMDTSGMIDPMDDLFGDPADGMDVPVPMVMPSAPLPTSLIFRVNDMQRTGCCSKLAWSNAGYMAQISGDGGKVTLRTVFRDQQSSSSSLSEESKFPVIAPDGVHFVHIQFSRLGTDLAVADNQGGVHVYIMAGVLGRLQLAPADVSVNEGIKTELDAVVGLHWLATWPTEFRAPYIGPATKIGQRWSTQMKMLDSTAPRMHHALDNRNALLYVTSSSKLVLLYQNEHSVWHSTFEQLEDWQSSNELLTHAAIGEEGDHVVLTTHDHDRRLRVYRVTVHWNIAQHSSSNGTYTTVSPTLDIGHLTILDHVCPQQAQMTSLSLLKIIPTIPSFASQGIPTITTVLAVFTHAPTPLAAAQQQQDAFGVIARWTVESVTPTLHECFAKLKPNGQVPAQNPVTVLRRQQDIMTNKIVLGIELLSYNTMVAFVNSVGSTEVYDHSTWAPIDSFGDTLMASSLAQSGLEYIDGDHTPHAALNPDGSAMVITKTDGTLDMRYVAPRYGWQPLEDGVSDTKGMTETAVICLARQYAILSTMAAATDEVLAVLPRDLSTDLRALFVKQTLRMLCRSLDLAMLENPKQQQTLLREQVHLRPLSAQLALGSKPGSIERDFAGQLAYVYLNMRQISYTLASTFSTRDNNSGRTQEVVPSLVPLFEWVTDLIISIVDTLAQVRRGMKDGQSAKEAFQNLVAETGNPALHVLLCSFPRILLRMQTTVFPVFLKWIHAAKARPRTLEHKQLMEDFCRRAEKMPFRINHFVELIAEFDAAVRSAYTESGASTERRVDIELAMLTEGVIPDELEPVVRTLMETILPKFEENADMGKVYFWDTQWLGILNSVPEKGATRYDAIRKVQLTKEMKLRVCRRCGAEMEDLPQEQIKQAPDWVKHAQRHCFCQGYWWPLG